MNVDEWLRRAVQYRQSNQLKKAEDLYRKVLAAKPAHADAAGGLGEVLVAMGRVPEAVGYYEIAAAASPRTPRWRRGLADAYHACGRLPEAVASYQRTLALAPDDRDALWGLGCALTTRGEFAAAAESLGRLVAVFSDWAEAQHNLGRALHEIGDTDAAIAAFRAAAKRLPSPEMSLGAIATIAPGASAATSRSILDDRRTLGTRASATPIDLPSPAVCNKLGNRLRIGYVSSFFRDRNWMKQVWALINHHDRTRVEVHLFSDDSESMVQGGYRRHPEDCFHDISRLSNRAAAEAIAAEGIEVLVDLNAYSKLSRLELYFHRPAPIIVAWYNMYATSGLSCFDYLIGDATVVLPEEGTDYSERILRVPGCYLPLEVGYAVPDVTPPPCLTRGYITFGSLAPQYKITPLAIAAWAEILKRSPGSRMLIRNRFLAHASNREFMNRQFDRHGVSPDRVRLEGPAEHFEFLATYSEIDLALDSFPYNGGTTTMESLWQGVPVLCFRGDRWASRISASILQAGGLGEFVAADINDYRDLAARLASDPQTPSYLAELRAKMRENLRGSGLCDVGVFAREMEEIYYGARRITSATVP